MEVFDKNTISAPNFKEKNPKALEKFATEILILDMCTANRQLVKIHSHS